MSENTGGFLRRTFLASLFLFCIPCLAQVLPFEVYGLNEGLPQSQVTCMAQDREGYLWIGTWGGLARFNGETFTSFFMKDGLPSNRVQRIMADRTGRLWLATGTGVCSWRDGRLEPAGSGLVREIRCRALAEDGRGNLWIGTDRGLVLKEGDQFRRVGPLGDPSLEPPRITDLLAEDGALLAATSRGIYRVEPAGGALLLPGSDRLGSEVWALARTPEGLWAGTATQGLWLQEGGAWRRVPEEQVGGRVVFTLSVEASGTLYAATNDAGLYFKPPGQKTFIHWDQGSGLPSNVVNFAREDREGNLWVGTDIGGLARLGGLAASSFGQGQGLPSPCVFGVTPDPSTGALWVSTLRGIALLETNPAPRALRTITRAQGLTNEWVYKVLPTPKGELWVLTDSGWGWWRPSGGQLRPYPTDPRLPAEVPRDFLLDKRGRLWFVGADQRGGLVLLDEKGSWRTISRSDDGFPLLDCRRLFARKAGGVWFSQDDRIFWSDGGRTLRLPDRVPLAAGAYVGAMMEDSRGRLWAGNDSGLAVRETDGRWQVLNDRPGFENRIVYLIGEDREGVTWVGTSRGVYLFLEDGSVRPVTTEDGLASLETNQEAFYCDREGGVWIGTVSGLTRFEPGRQSPNKVPPRIVVESAAVPGGAIAFPKGLSLSWRERSVTFGVAVLSYRNHRRCFYRAKLEGVDEEWLPLRRPGELRYTSLPAGRRQLLLQGVNDSGVWSEVASLPIHVNPPFWLTWWFRAAALLALVALAVAGHWWRTHMLRQSNLQLEYAVAMRTRELLDEKDRSERLLLNILPKPVADRLKRESGLIADSFLEATILFADIAEFTNFSAGIPPEELVSFLNEVFSAFDELAEKHGLEKIKTIGDAYMVVGGLPTPRPDHVQAVADMALDMRRAFTRLGEERGLTLGLRIGIHTGPVVAGVIGTKKFIYDLWGDTVNTASRMEQMGIPGAIQVTDTVFEKLRGLYTFEERGPIEVKGKGTMNVYVLVGEKGEIRNSELKERGRQSRM